MDLKTNHCLTLPTTTHTTKNLSLLTTLFLEMKKVKTIEANGMNEPSIGKVHLVLEIGTGYGHFMQDYCAKNPSVNFVGMDYKFKRSFNLVKKLDSLQQRNFFYLRANAARVDQLFGDSELEKVFYFFPDPWL